MAMFGVLPWMVLMPLATVAVEPLIIDHNDVDITTLSSNQINRAKAKLHIAYGHTSHGSQLIDGMNGLVAFANGGGKGLSLPHDIFAWEHRGAPEKLDLHNYAMGGDCGYYPQWYNNTVNYLNNPLYSNVNVVIWSWCGQMPGKWTAGTLTNEYLAPMAALETNYPDVVFVYMTGHVDHWSDAAQKSACQTIRNYCLNNNKVLYDFSDIECYDPDGVFYEFPNDNCDYYASAHGSSIGNWATAWQNSHVEDTDWYNCNSAHSQALNANQKAYAAWTLWCALGADIDRDGIDDEWEERYGGKDRFDEGASDWDNDGVTDTAEFTADTNPTNSAKFFRIDDVEVDGCPVVRFDSSPSRIYGLEWTSDLIVDEWTGIGGQTNKPGLGGSMCLTGTTATVQSFYRVNVKLP